MNYKEFGLFFDKFIARVTLIKLGDTVVHYGYSFTLDNFAGFTYWDYDTEDRLCIGIVFNRENISEEIIAHESWHLIFRLLQAIRENPSAEILGSEIWAYTFEDIFRKVRSAVNEMMNVEVNKEES